MTRKPLPKKLGKEPLIDVVCGVNFESEIPADTLLPGLLLSKLSASNPKFETLAAAQLPQIVRDNDPNLQNAPLMRIIVDSRFTILIGSKWLGVGCQMPYAGWDAFKGMILNTFGVLRDMPFVSGINSHSMKYVDFIKGGERSKYLATFNVRIEVAGRKLIDQTTQIRTEIVEAPFLHAATIMSPATAIINGEKADGSLIDVDTHRFEQFSPNDFLQQLPELLEEIHGANKAFFFDLLSEEGLQELEPKYE